MTARDELQQWIEDADRITGRVSGRMMDVDLARRVLAEMNEAHTWEATALDAREVADDYRAHATAMVTERDAALATLDAVRAHRRFHYTYADDVQVVVASELDAILDPGAGMSDLTTLIAGHHARYNAHRIWCSCGWEAFPSEVDNGLVAHAAHVAEVIGQKKFAVVELPEPGDPKTWPTPFGGTIAATFSHEVYESEMGGFMEPSEARELAAALLAAANAAEGKPHE